MAESKIKDTNYFMVSGWMLNRLGLKGVALQIFSIIYGFSQDGEGSFTGSLQYLCDFTNTTKNTVIKALKELTDLGYIQKAENTINGVRFCTYKIAPVVQKLQLGGAETEPGGSANFAPGGSAETAPNKEDLDNKSLISKEIEKVLELYHSICKSFPVVRKVTPQREKEIRSRLSQYTMEDFKAVFTNAENSSFLKGQNDRKWSANFDWLIGEKNIVKVLEGNYADKGRKEITPAWMKRELDADEKAAIDRLMDDDIQFAVNRLMSEDLQERAEDLRQRLQG